MCFVLAEYSTVRTYKKRPKRAFSSSASVAIGAGKRKIKLWFKFIGPLSKVNMFDLADIFFFIKRFCQVHSASSRLSPGSLAHSSGQGLYPPAYKLNHACSKLSAPSTSHVNSGLLGKYVSF